MIENSDFCRHCTYRIKSQREACYLLTNLILTAHMQSLGQGGTLIEAHLTDEMTVRLCLWEDGCPDCEDSHDAEVETWPERDSQYTVESEVVYDRREPEEPGKRTAWMGRGRRLADHG